MALGLGLGTWTFALFVDDHWSVCDAGRVFAHRPKKPYAHKSLIWFTIWSSVVHAAIMGIQALNDPAERGHLVGDVPALILFAIILAVLMPRPTQSLSMAATTVPSGFGAG